MVILQFLAYYTNVFIDTILVLIELSLLLFVFYQPVMAGTDSVWISCLSLSSFVTVFVPFYFYIEFHVVYHYNEVVRSFTKQTDYFNLVNKTGNPVFVV